VQRSVFECTVGDTELAQLKQRLRSLIDPAEDSLRIYHLDVSSAGRTEHIGRGQPTDLEGPFVAKHKCSRRSKKGRAAAGEGAKIAAGRAPL
jgi:hypothetical protein